MSPSRVAEAEARDARGQRLAELLIAAGIGAGRRLADALGIDGSLALGAGVGRLWRRLQAPRVARVRDQLARALPERTPAEREALTTGVFEHLGRGLFELLLLAGRHRASLLDRVEVAGLEHLEAARERSPGGGVLVVTAHFGNWELACARMAALGLPIGVVYRERGRRALDRALIGIREGRLVDRLAEASEPDRPEAAILQIPLGKRAGLRVVRALDAGRLLIVLLDQNARREEGVFVPFFGRDACTRSGPMLVADRCRVPVVMAFTRRLPNGRHRVEIQPALELSPGASDDDEVLRENVARASEAIEQAIRSDPAQWIWTHRRWRTQPRDTQGAS